LQKEPSKGKSNTDRHSQPKKEFVRPHVARVSYEERKMQARNSAGPDQLMSSSVSIYSALYYAFM
jgi:hypothetical protein